MAKKGRCRHCERENVVIRNRGLCSRCSADSEIVCLHPAAADYHLRDEPTEEEVEAMVAEGYANLPQWWQKDAAENKLGYRKKVGRTAERIARIGPITPSNMQTRCW